MIYEDKKRPLVSIIITTHRPDHFRNALSCAMAQTYRHFEIIVSDNSDDNQIKLLCDEHPEIIYRRNTNGTPSHNIYGGLELAKGAFIKYLFDDDLLYPHCLDSMLGWLNKLDPAQRASVGMVTASRHLIDDESVVYEHSAPANIHGTQLLRGTDACKDLIVRQYNYIGEFSTILFRREMVANLSHDTFFSAFGRRLHGLIDIPLYLHILRYSNLLFIPHALTAFRLHEAGGSNFTNSPDFHYVLTDWFELIEGAYEQGFLTSYEADDGIQRFLLHLDQDFPPQRFFAKEVAASRSRAEDFLAKLL